MITSTRRSAGPATGYYARAKFRASPIFSLNTPMPCQETAPGPTVSGLAGFVVGFAALAWVGALFAVLGAATLITNRKPG